MKNTTELAAMKQEIKEGKENQDASDRTFVMLRTKRTSDLCREEARVARNGTEPSREGLTAGDGWESDGKPELAACLDIQKMKS